MVDGSGWHGETERHREAALTGTSGPVAPTERPDYGYKFRTDAIALASPSGRMSKRALKAAQKRMSMELFGPGGLPGPQPLPYNKKESLLRQAKQLRELAAPTIGRDGRIIKGMHPRAYLKKAEELEAEARTLE